MKYILILTFYLAHIQFHQNMLSSDLKAHCDREFGVEVQSTELEGLRRRSGEKEVKKVNKKDELSLNSVNS